MRNPAARPSAQPTNPSRIASAKTMRINCPRVTPMLRRTPNCHCRLRTLAMTVFVTRDIRMARQLVLEKDNIRLAERGATESHLRRLREGTIASIETSALHLDILRDLKRINAHITSVAYPILEASGELRESRLRVAAE